MFESLTKKINDRSATVGVIGLGYVGLPLALAASKKGFHVIGVDINEWKVKCLQQGMSYVLDVIVEDLQSRIQNGMFSATTNFSILKEADIIIIAVPTPLSKSKTPDVTCILEAINQIKKNFTPGKLIILESTTYPGTTKELIVNDLDRSGFVLDRDFCAAFSPERVDPGNTHFHTTNTPKVVGGASNWSGKLAMQFYSLVVEKVVPVQTCEEAEMCKLLENTFRAVNIGFINEMTIMCDKMGINIWNVIEAAETKPFGFMPFYPGPGIGGHCIPLDPMYLSWKAKHFNFFNRSIELATEINDNMPNFIMSKLLRVMNERKKVLNGSTVLLLGIAYKPNTDDVRESPALEIYRLLEVSGAKVEFFDPYIRTFTGADGTVVEGLKILTAEKIRSADIVILTTNHETYNYEWIAENAKLIFDTRNGFRKILRDNRDNIVLL